MLLVRLPRIFLASVYIWNVWKQAQKWPQHVLMSPLAPWEHTGYFCCLRLLHSDNLPWQPEWLTALEAVAFKRAFSLPASSYAALGVSSWSQSSSCLRILNLWISVQIEAEKLYVLLWLSTFYYLLYLTQHSLRLHLNIVGLVGFIVAVMETQSRTT